MLNFAVQHHPPSPRSQRLWAQQKSIRPSFLSPTVRRLQRYPMSLQKFEKIMIESMVYLIQIVSNVHNVVETHKTWNYPIASKDALILRQFEMNQPQVRRSLIRTLSRTGGKTFESMHQQDNGKSLKKL
ncbi:uncharacterized protein ACBT44_003572 isoform 1-T1 [Syngnathus typhle]